jgi:hypothetical protein
MLILYLAVLITALYWVLRILLPEMTKPNSFDSSQSLKPDKSIEKNGPDESKEKLETLLIEKNKNIGLLQTELRILHVQVCAFDKIKTLLDEEIHRLREQNRIFRSELGLPAAQSHKMTPTPM